MLLEWQTANVSQAYLSAVPKGDGVNDVTAKQLERITNSKFVTGPLTVADFVPRVRPTLSQSRASRTSTSSLVRLRLWPSFAVPASLAATVQLESAQNSLFTVIQVVTMQTQLLDKAEIMPLATRQSALLFRAGLCTIQ